MNFGRLLRTIISFREVIYCYPQSLSGMGCSHYVTHPTRTLATKEDLHPVPQSHPEKMTPFHALNIRMERRNDP